MISLLAVMVAMVAATAMPAFAGGKCNVDPSTVTCSGGSGSGGSGSGGGSGGHLSINFPSGEFVTSGGGGSGQGGGGGGRCTGNAFDLQNINCTGTYK